MHHELHSLEIRKASWRVLQSVQSLTDTAWTLNVLSWMSYVAIHSDIQFITTENLLRPVQKLTIVPALLISLDIHKDAKGLRLTIFIPE